MAALLIGHIPVHLKLVLILVGVVPFSHATLNTEKNSYFAIPLPPVALLNLHIASLKASLKPLEGFLSSGWSQWEEWGSMLNTLIFFSYIIAM